MQERIRTGDSLLRNVVLGVASGVAASWAMTQFHVGLYGRGLIGTREPQSHRPVDSDDDAATKAADVVATTVTGVPLDPRAKQVGGPLVHYAFGATLGVIYAVAGRHVPWLRSGHGAAFGVVVWAAADELLLPALKLARGPRAYPVTVHLEMLAAHLVFGVATRETLSSLERRRDEAP